MTAIPRLPLIKISWSCLLLYQEGRSGGAGALEVAFEATGSQEVPQVPTRCLEVSGSTERVHGDSGSVTVPRRPSRHAARAARTPRREAAKSGQDGSGDWSGRGGLPVAT